MPPAEPAPWAPVGSAPAPPGAGYVDLQVTGRRHGAGWALLGVVALVVVLLAGNVAAGVVALVAVGGDASALSTDPLTPGGLALVNLGWAVSIPLVVLVALAVHGQAPGWLASVARRVRWGWFATCFGLAVVTLVVTVVVSSLLPAARGGDAEVTTISSGQLAAYLLVVVLLTPLQAAGEEYAFRGYLTQAVGSMVRPPLLRTVLAVVVPAVLFALAHGAQDPPVFVDRLAFGLVAGTVVVLTGGLEAGIAMHVLNNLLAFGVALLSGTIEGALVPTGGSWWSLPTTLTQSLVYLALVLLVARRRGLASRVAGGPPTVLEPPRGRV